MNCHLQMLHTWWWRSWVTHHMSRSTANQTFTWWVFMHKQERNTRKLGTESGFILEKQIKWTNESQRFIAADVFCQQNPVRFSCSPALIGRSRNFKHAGVRKKKTERGLGGRGFSTHRRHHRRASSDLAYSLWPWAWRAGGRCRRRLWAYERGRSLDLGTPARTRPGLRRASERVACSRTETSCAVQEGQTSSSQSESNRRSGHGGRPSGHRQKKRFKLSSVGTENQHEKSPNKRENVWAVLFWFGSKRILNSSLKTTQPMKETKCYK